MAFQEDRFNDFYQMLRAELGGSEVQQRAVAENFLLEERLTAAREDSYEGHLEAPADFGDWNFCHENYLAEKITIKERKLGLPETFMDIKRPTFLSGLPEDQYLVRLEKLDPQNAVCRNGLAEMLKLRGALEEAELICREAMRDFPRNVHCRTVLAVVLLQGGKREEAIAVLEETRKKFPQDKFSAGFLEKLKAGQTDELPELADTPAVFSCAEEEDDGFADFAAIPTAAAQDLPAEADELAEDTQETALGLLNLHRQAGDYAEARTNLDKLLAPNPDSISISARLEQGLLYLAQDDAATAAEHFRRQSKLHPNAPGFQIGLQRAQVALSNIPDEQRFQELAEQYPVKETIIRVEQFRLVPSVDAAKLLHQRINKGLSLIPLAERGHEKWFQETVQQTVFKGIDFRAPFAKDDLPKLVENCHKHEHRLSSAAEQCLLAA